MTNKDYKKNIVAVMTKIKLKDNFYQFICNDIIEGYYDDESNLFYDELGNVYSNINTSSTLDDSTVNYFHFPMLLNELDAVFKSNPLDNTKDSIELYKDFVNNKLCYVTSFLNGESQLVTYVDVKDIDRLESDVRIRGNEITTINEFIPFVESFDYQYGDDRVLKFLDPSTDYSVCDEELNKLIANIYNCDFNSEELLTMLVNINNSKENFDQVIETIKLQLLAYRDGNKVPNNPVESDYTFRYSDYNPYLGDEDFSSSSFEQLDDFDGLSNSDIIDINNYYATKLALEERIDITGIREEISKYLINQDYPLRRMLVEIAKSIESEKKNKGILLTGDTGVGKTYMMELIGKYLGRPVLIIDSTQLTVPGFVGKDIQEYLWDLLEMCNFDLPLAENAIIVFDEIDKKGSGKKSDASGTGVLNVLLKFLDGTTYDATRDTKHSDKVIKINTRNMLVVGAGAFEDVFKALEKPKICGFTVDDSKQKLLDEYEMNLKGMPSTEVFVAKALMTPEFMGRVPVRIRMNSHDAKSFGDILRNSKDSSVLEEIELFDKFSTKLTFTDGLIKLMCEKAIKDKTGVRGLMGVVREITWVAFEKLYTTDDPSIYKEFILSEKTLDDPFDFDIIYTDEYMSSTPYKNEVLGLQYTKKNNHA